MKTRDILLAIFIIAFLVFTYIPVEEAEEQGGPAFGTEKKTERLSDIEVLEQPIPAAE